MAALSTAAIIAGGAALVGSGAQIYQGVKQTKDAKDALKNLEVPDFDNPYENIGVSTLGSDLLKEQGQLTTANLIEAARSSGARGVMSSVPRIAAINNQVNQQAAKMLDDQVIKRNYAIADYEGKINQVEENRYQNELGGIGNLMNTGQQNTWNGINGAITSFGSLARAIPGSTGSTGFSDKISTTPTYETPSYKAPNYTDAYLKNR